MWAEHQWLQLDLGPPTQVTGIVTKGRGDKKTWVTSYSLSYSNDTKIWFYYKDANHLEAKVSPACHVPRVRCTRAVTLLSRCPRSLAAIARAGAGGRATIT